MSILVWGFEEMGMAEKREVAGPRRSCFVGGSAGGEPG